MKQKREKKVEVIMESPIENSNDNNLLPIIVEKETKSVLDNISEIASVDILDNGSNVMNPTISDSYDAENKTGVTTTGLTIHINDDISTDESVEGTIFQILTGDSDDEFYTFLTPEISKDKKYLICQEVLIKKIISIEVLNEVLTSSYSEKQPQNINHLLENGVLIKTLPIEYIYDWWEITKEAAESALKDQELQIYRKTIPALVNQSSQQPKKNYLI